MLQAEKTNIKANPYKRTLIKYYIFCNSDIN